MNFVCFGLSISHILAFIFLHALRQSLHAVTASPAAAAAATERQDFLLTPDDYKNDEDIAYIVSEINRPTRIESFYLNAAQLYEDLPKFYKELQSHHQLAHEFLICIRAMAIGNMSQTLTVTHIFVSICKYFQKMFEHHSEPIHDMAQAYEYFMKEPDQRKFRLMTQFFMLFTLREINSIEKFVRLMSRATLKKPPAHGDAIPDSVIDVSRTQLHLYSERILLALANSLAKIKLLLDVFLEDPSVADRSVRIVKRIWNIHLSRLSTKLFVPVDDLPDHYQDLQSYRKININFTFSDWEPKLMQTTEMKSLRAAAEAERQAFIRSRLFPPFEPWSRTKAVLVAIIFFAFSFSLLFAAFHIVRSRIRSFEQDEEEISDSDGVSQQFRSDSVSI